MSNPLQAEVDRLQKYIADYGAGVSRKMDLIEESFGQMEAENRRLVTALAMMRLERDACVALLARLAASQGLAAGSTAAGQIAVELPSGQVSWQLGADDAHLLDGLPPYTAPIEELAIEACYARVMNPGLSGTT